MRRSAATRSGAPSAYVVVGLGNPGDAYVGTRHNVGAAAVELLAQRHGATLKAERHQRARLAQVHLGEPLVTLAVPTTFMNESGAAIPPLLDRSSVDDLRRLVVVHDELDLEPGVIRLKGGGGLAGHNGLRSIAKVLGSQDFLRVRIGIGKPPSKEQGADHVLRRLSATARAAQDLAVTQAADAVELLCTLGLEGAMAQVHR